MTARKTRGGHESATLSGVIYKSNKEEESKSYRYSEKGYGQASFVGSSKQAYVHLPLEVINDLLRTRAINQAAVLGMLLHRQADMRRWPVVKLPTALLNQCGFDRRTVSRALQQLECAGLIRVHRKPGKRSTVTVLWHPIRELCFVPSDDEEGEGEG